MTIKKIFVYAIWVIINSFQILAQNQSPQISNVTFSQRTDGSFFVDINYDVNDPENDVLNVAMKVSDDNGVTWNFSCNNITGDVGAGITNGAKHIEWDFGTEHSQTFGDQFKIKIIADDGGGTMGEPCPGIPTITDPRNGKVYNTVLIGTQCWLKENMDIGTMIPGSQNQTSGNGIEKYCYADDPINCTTYGGLYQWDEAMQYVTNEGAKGICPTGWHIPSLAEFQTLSDEVGSDGNALKEIGQGTGGGAGTNTSGFSALLAGYRTTDGGFANLGYYAYFWSSSEYDATFAYLLYLGNNDSYISLDYNGKDYGFSVRCIKDESPIVQSCPGTPTVTYEGKIYNTVLIGDQCWLKENLDVGVMIDSTLNQTNNSILEKYCYNDNPSNCAAYGGLYQWDEAMQYVTNEGSQGICPTGWHIPKFAEFQTLRATVNNDGNSLKEIGQGTGGGAGTNTSGFSALLAGHRDDDGYFYGLGNGADFWSSREFTATNAYFLYLYGNASNVYLDSNIKNFGFSVRCLKD